MADSEKTPWWAHVVALSFIVVGGLVEWHTVSTFLETQSVQSWPKVEGKIASSEVSWKTLRPEPAIAYENVVNGKPYRSAKSAHAASAKEKQTNSCNGTPPAQSQRSSTIRTIPKPATWKPTSISPAT
ncbi:MAG: hypothetical protein K2X38_09340 [Gemmataceae bacterium]|nr:hypothetical protein [Gemmataceae bacterium]